MFYCVIYLPQYIILTYTITTPSLFITDNDILIDSILIYYYQCFEAICQQIYLYFTKSVNDT